MKTCVWCMNEFQPKVSYQVYCDAECRTLATRHNARNKRISARIERNRRNPRRCAGGCGTIISIYNDQTFCLSCGVDEKKVAAAIERLGR